MRSLQDPEAWWHKPEEGAITPPWSRPVELTGRAHTDGVRLALGTDAGNPVVFHGLAVHCELELLVRAGIAPMDALLSATAHAAAKAGASDTIGTIEPGKEADLVALTGSPLEDVRNARGLDLVMKRGKLFDRGALTVRSGRARLSNRVDDVSVAPESGNC